MKNLVWDELRAITKYRYDSDDPGNVENFLNSAASLKSSNRYSSHWTRARAAARRIGVSWSVDENFNVKIICDEVTIFDRKTIFSNLRLGLRKMQTRSLVDDHPHQGKTFECVCASRFSSHFFIDGSFTTFREWRFVHRARLGMVPLNAYKHGRANPDKQYRVCGYQAETLPHVINNCMTHSMLIEKRHNDIVSRIKKAAMVGGSSSVQRKARLTTIFVFCYFVFLLPVVTWHEYPEPAHMARHRCPSSLLIPSYETEQLFISLLSGQPLSR